MNFMQWILSWFKKPTTTTTTTTKKPTTTTTTTTVTEINLPSTTTTTTTLSGGSKMKIALVFSINNYPGTQNDLQGCNNDSKGWEELLKYQYGFEVTRMIDSEVTLKNITNAMNDLIVNSKAGDVLVMTYSGYGTSVADLDGDELDGKDECICLYDGLMKDDVIRNIFNKLPQGVKLTFISDSCFSGTNTRSFFNCMNDFSYVSKPKYLPPADDMEAVRLLSLPSLKAFAYPEETMNHILISGTDDKSYSYDANFNGIAAGAFSYYAIQILKNNPKMTYNEFYGKLKGYIPSSRYPQNPQLEGSAANKGSLMFE